MAYTVRLSAAELSNARGVEKMDIGDMPPKLAFNRCLCLSFCCLLSGFRLFFAALLDDRDDVTMHCIATALKLAFWKYYG